MTLAVVAPTWRWWRRRGGGGADVAVVAPTALAGLALGRYWREAAPATVVVAAASAALLVVRGAAPV